MSMLLPVLLFLAAHMAQASHGYQQVTLQEGIVLKVKRHGSNRALPHAFYDQATASIPALYPEHVFLAKRRRGRLGEIEYSIICYKETGKLSEVVITGVAVATDSAWSFETHVPEASFGDRLLVVLEAVEELPSNQSFQPPAKSLSPGSGGRANRWR